MEIQKKVYDKNNSIEVEKNYIVDNYISLKDNMGYSMVRTHLKGSHPYMKNIKSNRSYYFINGKATFYFDNKIIELVASDVICIPANTKYAFKGEFDAILVDCPAFDSKDDIIYSE